MLSELQDVDLSEAERSVREEVRSFVAEEIDPLDFDEWEWRDDPRDRIPWAVLEAAYDRGLQDLTVPEEFGGRDASPLTLAVAAEELSYGDMSIAINIDQMWKIARIVDGMATDQTRERFFEAFVDDPRHLLAIGLTEPATGTDYVIDHEDMQFDTVAERDGDEWVLNGRKRFISCAPEAKSLVIYAQSDPEASAQSGTTAFLVPHDADGMEITHVWERLSVRLHNQGTIDFEGVRLPDERRLGEVHQAKRNTADVLRESSIEAGSIAIGTARRAFEEAYAYANERVQGGTELVNHQQIAHDFARMATDLQTARSLLRSAARSVEAYGDDYDPLIGQMAKVNASTTAIDVCQQSLEMFGGMGIMFENDRPAQKYLRDSLTYLHADGTVNGHFEVIANALQTQFDRA